MIFKITFSVLLFIAGCGMQKNTTTDLATLAKINFDLNQFDENGRYGPADGLRIMDYEFCIPRTEDKVAIIKKIDPAIQMPEKGRGRIGCTKTEQLCLGNTGKAGWKDILVAIAKQDFVERIEPNYYE